MAHTCRQLSAGYLHGGASVVVFSVAAPTPHCAGLTPVNVDTAGTQPRSRGTAQVYVQIFAAPLGVFILRRALQHTLRHAIWVIMLEQSQYSWCIHTYTPFLM